MIYEPWFYVTTFNVNHAYVVRKVLLRPVARTVCIVTSRCCSKLSAMRTYTHAFTHTYVYIISKYQNSCLDFLEVWNLESCNQMCLMPTIFLVDLTQCLRRYWFWRYLLFRYVSVDWYFWLDLFYFFGKIKNPRKR